MAGKILYIEDNNDNALMIKLILQREGYTVTIANNGETGLQQTEEFRPDVIICDYHLPGMIKGTDFVQKIRQTPHLTHIPIIMLTADTTTYPDSMDAGATLYLNKPIGREPLLKSIRSLL